MLEPPPGMRVGRFGPFEVNLTTGELRKHGIRLKLQDQPFQILAMLLARPGKLVTREEIRHRLWPSGTFVDFDNGLNTALCRLREALGDSAESPSYIETLARRGYRWMVSVDWMSSRSADLSAAVSVEAPSEAEATSDNLIGKKISHYRVLGVLGGGGMGLVYRAEDIKLGRGVALKFLPEELAHDAAALERFEREARAASALNHPHICTIYEFGDYEGQPFIVMELLEGQTLRERLGNARERLRKDELIDLAIQITDGLDAAHQKGIIHRDIKPANIFLTNRGEAKILDFGLARIVNLDEHPHNPLGEKVDETCPPRESKSMPSLNSTLTHTGAMLGTVSYMSPEQVRGEKLDSRTDLFSFGLVLYEMATGQRAFRGNTVTQVNEAILNREPPSATVNPAVPPKLEEVISNKYQIRTFKSDGSDERKLLEESDEIDSARWSPTGDSIYFLHGKGTTRQLSKLSVTRRDAEPVVLADGLQTGDYFTVSADGSRLAYTRQDHNSNLWRVDLPTDERVKPEISRLTSGTSYYGAPSFSPDGYWIAFALGPNPDETNIFKTPVAGGESVQLTFFEHATTASPAWSPDGQRIAFIGDQSGTPKVWMISAKGGAAQPLENTNASDTNNKLAWWPSSDIIYQQTGVRNYLRINDKTRDEKPIIQHDQSLGWVPARPVFSPDGKKMAVLWNRKDNEGTSEGLSIISPEPYSEMLLLSGYIFPVGWSPDGKYLYAIRLESAGQAREIIRVRVASPGEVTSVATLPGDVNDYDGASVSSSGHQIIVSLREDKSDVWLMENFDPSPR